MKSFFCLFLILIAFAGNIHPANDCLRFDSIVHEMEAYAYAYPQKAETAIEKLQALSLKNPGNNYFITQVLYWKVRTNYIQDKHDPELLPKCLATFDTLPMADNTIEKALAELTLALCYSIDDNYAYAFEKALKSLEQFRELSLDSYIVITLNLMGSICLRIQSLNMAINYYEQALALVSSGQRAYYALRINLYTARSFMEIRNGKALTAIDSLITFIPKLEQFRDTSLLISAYYILGTVSFDHSDRTKGYDYYKICRSLMEQYQFENQSYRFGLDYNLGKMYLVNKNYTEALRYLYAAKSIENKTLLQESYTLDLLSDTYTEMGQIDSAYHYLSQYKAIEKQLVNNAKTIESYQAYISMFLESTRQELAFAQQAISLRNKQFLIFVISAVSVLALIFLLLVILHQQKRNIKQQERLKEIENEQLKNQLLQNAKIKKLEEEKHQELLDTKMREVASYSLLLTNKNEVLQQIADTAKHLPAGNTNIPEIHKKITEIIQSNLSVDNHWNDFVAHFDKIHPHFFDRLKALCPNLTEHNLRLCAYFRIGIAPKQIAQMLNVSINNIKKIRYRLKKKFDLDENKNIDDFLRNI